MLKSSDGEECLSRTSVFEWHERLKEGLRKWECKKSRVETMLITFFYAKGIIHHEFVPGKQTANGKFNKEVIK
jgi:hypothetical protein